MDMQRSAPSEVGVDATGILGFLDAIEGDARIEPHGFILQRHGHRIAEGYWAPHSQDRRRLVYSLSKSFTGTALALQLGEGRLRLDDLVSDHLPEMFDDQTDERTRRMRIRHIASMSSGHNREMIEEAYNADPTDPVRGFLRIPPDAEPGTLFAYSQPPVLTLARILENLAGERLVNYLGPRLFEPLGIDTPRWTQQQPGHDLGFSGLFTNLDAVARLGQLYLDDGVWDGQRLLPEGWVADASSVHVDNSMREDPDWAQGYGFQLWNSRHGYRGDGAFGQYMVILPEQDTVIAMFCMTTNMQAVLDLMWDHLLPALATAETLGQSASASDALLAGRLASLTAKTAAESVGGTLPAHLDQRFEPRHGGPNAHWTITAIDVQGDLMVVHEGESSFAIPFSTDWLTAPGYPMATSATRLANGDVVVDVLLLDTPHRLRLTLEVATATFTAIWPEVPLFGLRLSPFLQAITAPVD